MFDDLFNSIDALVAEAKADGASLAAKAKDVWSALTKTGADYFNALISNIKFACPPGVEARAQTCKAALDTCPCPKAAAGTVGAFDLSKFLTVLKTVLSLFGL